MTISASKSPSRSGFGSGENEHLNAARRAVRGRREVGVVDAGAILGIGLHGIVAQAAAAEVVLLEIARGLGETQIVELVVHPIAPIEKLHHRGVRVVGRAPG